MEFHLTIWARPYAMDALVYFEIMLQYHRFVLGFRWCRSAIDMAERRRPLGQVVAWYPRRAIKCIPFKLK